MQKLTNEYLHEAIEDSRPYAANGNVNMIIPEYDETIKESSEKIHQMFQGYKEDNDLVGMDMARKFLQMGYTRSRRYANYKGGKKYDDHGDIKKRDIDEEKAESARIFEEKWIKVREDEMYLKKKKAHQKQYG